MARNTVSTEFTVTGSALADIATIEAAMRRYIGLAGPGLTSVNKAAEQSARAAAAEFKAETGAIGVMTAELKRQEQESRTFVANLRAQAEAAKQFSDAADTTGGKASTLRTVLAGFAGGAVGGAVISFFRDATSAAIAFGAASVDAAEKAAAAQTFLQTSAKLTGEDFSSLSLIAERVRTQFGVTRAEAQELVARAAQFTSAAGRPNDTEAFLKAVADSAAAAGHNLKELPEILQQLSGGGLEAALDKVLGGKNPSQIFAERFKEVGAANAQALTDAQQKALVLNEILARTDAVAGTAAAQFDRLGGKVQIARSRFEDLEASIGKVIERNQGVATVVDTLTKLTEKADDPATAAGVERIGEAFGGLAQAAATGIGAVAVGLALLKTGVDAIVTTVTVAATAIADLGPIISASLREGVYSGLAEIQKLLPESAQKLFGIAGIDAEKMKALAHGELSGLSESFNQLAISQGKVIVDDMQRVIDLIELTKKGIGLAGDLGKFTAPTGLHADASIPNAKINGQSVTATATLGQTQPVQVIDLDALARKGGGKDIAIPASLAGINAALERGALTGLLNATSTQTVQGAPVLIATDTSLESVDGLRQKNVEAAVKQADAAGKVHTSNERLIEETQKLREENKKLRESIDRGAIFELQVNDGLQVESAAQAGGVISSKT